MKRWLKTLYTLLSCIEHLFWIKFNDFYPSTCLLLNRDCSFLNSGWFQNLHCYKPIRMFTIGWAVYIFSYPINHFFLCYVWIQTNSSKNVPNNKTVGFFSIFRTTTADIMNYWYHTYTLDQMEISTFVWCDSEPFL